ncbi:protein kinase [Rhodococcus sp. KBS0724]|uniref:protein kinase domain-containing protein n=1 Tax=Rhodococcus sp. KBS0724 TaxID=1179674 RepID=UPI00110E7862|nr:protein kinase [Rhodococcus sp. KBS0724]TSD40397.1 protein kinase [Rhodococcus sp. KBS0724]
MGDFDPLSTQQDVARVIAEELGATGFIDVHEIGRGGFGVVFRCRQPSLDRVVAVKVLTADVDSENVARFLREQRAMGRVSGHPHIVTVHDVGTTDSGRPFIVMQYHRRGSLEVEIRRNGPLPWTEVLRIGAKMAGALETLHRLGVLHRDVKPGNILIADYGQPQLTDFGIARIAGAFETGTGTVTGSPAFTAPEVLRGDAPSVFSDIYGLGATLFCALTGHAAFERLSGEHVVAQFLRITSEPTPELSGWDIPEDFRAIIERSMARTVGERPGSAEELGNLLVDAARHNEHNIDEMALPAREREYRADVVVGTARGAAPAGHDQDSVGESSSLLGLPRRSKDGNLPYELTSFIGRRHESAEARHLLSGARLVTFTGIGGVGKTRLALKVGSDARRAFADGVWLVELGQLRDPALLADTFAGTFGLQERSARPPSILVAEYLADRQLLLIVDNCEHMIAAVAKLVEALLRVCPDVKVLATSREPLGIGGEMVMRVPPLTVPDTTEPAPSRRGAAMSDAVALFVERSRSAVPDFVLTDDNKAIVTQICRQLEGLPLSIELAAVRLRSMSAVQIRDRITDSYALLTRGHRGAPSRQQSLRLSIDWSYWLCTPDEQRLWAQVSVFAGSFDLDGVEGVSGQLFGAVPLVDLVESLVGKSILIREETAAGVRFRLLETLRAYGRRRLDEEAGEYAALARRHRDYYLQMVKHSESEWISPKQTDWIALLRQEQPNIRDALEFCASETGEAAAGLEMANALYLFWFTRGMFSEGRRWLGRLLTLDAESLTAERIHALCWSAEMAGLQGDNAAATPLVVQARNLVQRLDQDDIGAEVFYIEGNSALYSGDPGRAVTLFERALGGLHPETNLVRRIEALVSLGVAGWVLGDATLAVASHQEVLALTTEHGESVYRAHSLWSLGLVSWNRGRAREGYELLEEGIRSAHRVDDPVSGALCVEALSWIAADEGREERAAVLMGAARALRKTMGASSVRIPAMVDYHTQCVRRTRTVLGAAAYATAFRHGQALDFDEIAAVALDDAPPETSVEPTEAENALTKRERQVAELISEGLTNRKIAEKLFISPRTAQGHVENILVKLGFSSRTQIAAWFIEHAR